MDRNWLRRAKGMRKSMAGNLARLDELIAEVEAVANGGLVGAKPEWPPSYEDWREQYIEAAKEMEWPKPGGCNLKGLYYQTLRALKKHEAELPDWDTVKAGAAAMRSEFGFEPNAPGWLVTSSKDEYPNILKLARYATKPERVTAEGTQREIGDLFK